MAAAAEPQNVTAAAQLAGILGAWEDKNRDGIRGWGYGFLSLQMFLFINYIFVYIYSITSQKRERGLLCNTDWRGSNLIRTAGLCSGLAHDDEAFADCMS